MIDRLQPQDLEDRRPEALPAATRQRLPTTGSAFAIVAAALLLLGAGPLLAEGGGDALFIDGEGRVGIGTTAPQQTLDVAGTIRSQKGGIQFPDGTIQTTLAVPVGAVIAFDLEACPPGWSDYKPAYGRFVRGIDRSGERIDQDGERTLGLSPRHEWGLLS